MRLIIKIFLFLSILFMWEPSSTYPIPPQTLKNLILNAQYIVIARVNNPPSPPEPIKYFDKNKNDTVIIYRTTNGEDGSADLHLIDVLKGSIDKSIITVKYPAWLLCPAPPSYPDNKTVITFLSKSDTSETYSTIGLSYGSKIMDFYLEQINLKSRIIELLEILQITKNTDKEKAIVEWLVKCAENKFNRWDGAYELTEPNIKSEYNKERRVNSCLKKYLKKEQTNRLKTAFLNADTITRNELLLTAFFPPSENHLVINKLLEGLNKGDFWEIRDIAAKLYSLDRSVRFKSLNEELEKVDYKLSEEKRIEEAKIIVKNFFDTNH